MPPHQPPSGAQLDTVYTLNKEIQKHTKRLKEIGILKSMPSMFMENYQLEEVAKEAALERLVAQLQEQRERLLQQLGSGARTRGRGGTSTLSEAALRQLAAGSTAGSTAGDVEMQPARSRSNSSVSLASVAAAATGEDSEYYQHPPTPARAPAAPVRPLRRSDVPAGASSEEVLRQQEQAAERAAVLLQTAARRSQQQRERRAREAASNAAVAALQHGLERRALHVDQLLMLEHVLQPRNYGLPIGRLRLDFLDLRGDSRARGPKTDGRKKGVSLLPSVSQAELLAMSGIQSLLLRNDELREVTLEAIEVEKERI